MPAAISAPSVPVASRAQWRLAGESDAMWRDSGASASGLVPGVHVIECKPVDGRSTPVPATVVVTQCGAPAVSDALLNHYALLATIEDGFGLPRLRKAAGAPTMMDLFARPCESEKKL